MIASGRLAYQRLYSSRLAEALALADQAVSYAQQAEVGPWTKLGTEVQRLQMLSEMEDTDRVLSEVQRLRHLMEALDSSSGEDEAVRSWDVREALLNIGRSVRIELEEWDEALAINAEITASMHDRRAPASQTAVVKMNDYGPLLRLGNVSQARSLLLDCRRAFQDANDLRMLGTTLGALADVEEKLGHVDNAIKLAHDALRYGYAAGDAATVRDVYHNLGNYLVKHVNQPIPALACHLCAALIKALSGTTDTERSVRAASVDLYVFGNAVEPPTGIEDLSRRIGDIPGTDPAALIARLSPDPETAERTLQDLIARARKLAETSLEGTNALVDKTGHPAPAGAGKRHGEREAGELLS